MARVLCLFAFVALIPTHGRAQTQPIRESDSSPADQSWHWAFGFSMYTYEVGPSDLVFTDPMVHRLPAIGWRISYIFDLGRWLDLMIDGEFLLSNVAREVEGWDFPKATLTGYQAFIGPVVNLGRFAAYGAFGANQVGIDSAEISSGVDPFNITYYGNSGLSQLWAKHMNERISASGSGGGNVPPHIPGFKDRAVGMVVGISYRLFSFGEHEGMQGMRFAAEWAPLLRDPVRHNMRLTVSFSG